MLKQFYLSPTREQNRFKVFDCPLQRYQSSFVKIKNVVENANRLTTRCKENISNIFQANSSQ